MRLLYSLISQIFSAYFSPCGPRKWSSRATIGGSDYLQKWQNMFWIHFGGIQMTLRLRVYGRTWKLLAFPGFWESSIQCWLGFNFRVFSTVWSAIFFKDLQIQNASCYGKLFDMAMPVVSRVDFSIQGEGSTENPEFLSKQIQTVRGGNLYPYMFFQRICTAVVLICIQHRRVSLKIQLYYSSSNLFSCSYRVSRSWNLFTFTTNKRQFQWFWSL